MNVGLRRTDGQVLQSDFMRRNFCIGCKMIYGKPASLLELQVPDVGKNRVIDKMNIGKGAIDIAQVEVAEINSFVIECVFIDIITKPEVLDFEICHSYFQLA